MISVSQGIWHQTKEDMVVLGNCCHGNRGAISEHQPGFHMRKVLIQMTASSLPQTSPPFPVLFKERGGISPRDRGEAKPL